MSGMSGKTKDVLTKSLPAFIRLESEFHGLKKNPEKKRYFSSKKGEM